MFKIKLPEKIIELYTKTGVISLGERHGIKENYDIYKSIINELPKKPNLAVEFGYFDKIEFEKFLKGEKLNSTDIGGDGRLNMEYFIFLKEYITDNPSKKIIYFAEAATGDSPKPVDEQDAEYFLKVFEKPTVIICGETHARKEIINWSDGYVQKPMCAFIKEKIGDFPNIKIMPASGECYYMNKITKIPDNERICGEIIDRGNNNYEYNFEKATPTTPIV